jgi:hypothetical protein
VQSPVVHARAASDYTEQECEKKVDVNASAHFGFWLPPVVEVGVESADS